MAAPPPKKGTPEDLAEVERALSILKGRHPEHERLQREDNEKRAERDAARAVVEKRETKKRRAKQLVYGGGGLLVLAAVLVIVLSLRREMGRRSGLDHVAEPWKAVGFTLVESSGRGDPSKLEASGVDGCVLAMSTGEAPAKLKLTASGGSVSGTGPLLTCLCEPGTVAVAALPGELGPGEGLVLLRADASTIGGTRAFPYLPFEVGKVGATDGACADASLEAWFDAKRWREDPPALPREIKGRKAPRVLPVIDASTTEKWLGGAARAALRDAGFKVASAVDPHAPFAAVDVPKESCVLVLPEEASGRTVLRSRGAVLAGAVTGPRAWCTSGEVLMTVHRELEPGGEIAILVGPAARVGGLLGLGEIASTSGIVLPAESMSVPGADHGWNARQTLLASAIPETLITIANAPDLGVDPEARIVALSVEKAGILTSESPDGVFSFCTPSLQSGVASVCVFSGSQKWHIDGTQAAGIARAKLPFWLFALQGISEPAALKLETELITLARRLRRDGFEPTTIEAVTDLDKGAEVLGRANEDAMVVVGLAPVDPWVFPYTDGVPWTLGGEPRVIPIKPLERIVVSAAPPTTRLPPKATRRTLVFRRQKR